MTCLRDILDHLKMVCLRNVSLRERIAVSFAQTEIDDVDDVRLLSQTDHKVVGFHVAMNVVLAVEILQSENQFLRNHAHCLQGEAPVAVVKQVLQTRSQQLHHHHVEITLHAIIVHGRNTHSALQLTIHLVLKTQLRTFGVYGFQFDRHLFAYSITCTRMHFSHVEMSVPR